MWYCLWCHLKAYSKQATSAAGECQGQSRRMIEALEPRLKHQMYIAEYLDNPEFILICRRCGKHARTRLDGLTKEVCSGKFMHDSAKHAWTNVQNGREPKASR